MPGGQASPTVSNGQLEDLKSIAFADLLTLRRAVRRRRRSTEVELSTASSQRQQMNRRSTARRHDAEIARLRSDAGDKSSNSSGGLHLYEVLGLRRQFQNEAFEKNIRV